VVGLAPGAKILPIRVLDAKNAYDDPQTIAEGIVFAADHGAKVINLSLGSEASSPLLAEAIDYAFARDVVVVACVGNVLPNGTGDIWHPAREPGVIAVTALDSDGKFWKGSLTGKETVLAAPGSILMGARPHGYEWVQGTSFAAPLVSAAAALIRSQYPQMSAANVVERLIVTARDAGAPGRDERYGFGIVDPFAALTSDVPLVSANPLDTTPPPGRAVFGPARDSAVLPSGGVPSSPAAAISGEPVAVAGRDGPRPNSPPLGLAAGFGVFALLVGGTLAFLRRADR
jgi:subtilisin family serine protease